jgi:hypothetical protein
MSDSVKKWFEMQKENEHKEVLHTHAPNKKAYRILIDYNIEDIREAVRLYNKNMLDE